jgi:hypothetical protein
MPSPPRASAAGPPTPRGSRPGRSDREIEAFFNALHRAYSDAEEASGEAIQRFFRVGGHVLHLRFAGPALVDPLSAALAHLACDAPPRAALTVCLFDTASTATSPPPCPWGPEEVYEGGLVEEFSSARFHTVFQVAVRLLTILDRERGLAVCWAPGAEHLRMPERAAPLRRLLQAWKAEHETLLVHGGAVGFPDGGVLLAGQGGVGKSTAALACLASSLSYAGDDYCLLDAAGSLRLHSLYGTGKTDASALARLPFLASMVSNRDRLATEKALYFLHDHVPHKLTAGFPLRAVLLPRLTWQRDTALVPSSPGAVLRALAPTTVLLSPQTAARTLPLLADLARRVPAYELRMGSDAAEVPVTIIQFLADLRNVASPTSRRGVAPPAVIVT